MHDIPSIASTRRVILLLTAVALALWPLGLTWAQESAVTTSPAGGAGERYVSIDFNSVDINVFIKFISELTNTNFVVDQRVKGKVTVISPARISVAEAYRVFESVLEVHGYTTVQAGEVRKIVPSPDARAKNIETLLREESGRPEDRVVTQVLALTYADPNEIKRLFTPLVSKNSVILAYAPTSTLIVTDVHSNIQRLIKILTTIDVAGTGLKISVLPVTHADAVKMVKVLGTVFKPAPKGKKGASDSTARFVADERTNTLVVLASAVDTERIQRLVEMLDREIPRGEEKLHVYYLENASAEELVKVLQELVGKQVAAAKTEKGKRTAPVVSEKVRITHDAATNSLILMADKDDYIVLAEIIRKLDIPRAMVYIECMIAEVDVDNDLNLGVEWRSLDVSKPGYYGRGSGGFTGNGSYRNLNNLGSGLTSPPTSATLPAPGFSIGITDGLLKIGDLVFKDISAMIQAMQKDKDVHILSTPQILTTDNQEASIYVGKNVPYQTRSSAVATDLTTYESFEYRDVGITLKITPQISKDRMVRLEIFQEVTKIDEVATLITGVSRPTTLKRTIETTAIVRDRGTVVIGGLIDDQLTLTKTQVPCLGDVPIMGHLFKTRSRAGERTNLYVFLTPRVVENSTEATQIYKNKRQDLEETRGGAIKLYPGEKSGKSGQAKPASKD